MVSLLSKLFLGANLRFFIALLVVVWTSPLSSTEIKDPFSKRGEAVGYIVTQEGDQIIRYMVSVPIPSVEEERPRRGREELPLNVNLHKEVVGKAKTYEKEINILEMKFQNVPLEIVLKAIADVADVNLIFDPVVKMRLTSTQRDITKRFGQEEFAQERVQDKGILEQPVNFFINKPIKLLEAFNIILKEYDLIAVPLAGNTYSISKAVEYKLDIKGISGDNLERLIKLIESRVSPAAEVVIDKSLQIMYIRDTIDNLYKFKDLDENLEVFMSVEEEKPEIETKVFYLQPNYGFEDVKGAIQGTKYESMSFSKEFNALIISAYPKDLQDIENRLRPFLKSTSSERLIVTKTFYLKFISAEAFRRLVQPLLSEVGEVYVLGSGITPTTAEEKELRKVEAQIKDVMERLFATNDTRLQQALRQELQQLRQRYNELENRILQAKRERDTRVRISGYPGLSENLDATGPLFGKEKGATTLLANAVVIRDYINVIETIKEKYRDVISEEPIQIKIEARIVEIDEESLKELGVNWSALLSSTKVPSAWNSSVGINPDVSGPTPTPRLLGDPFTGGILTFVYQRGILNALNLRISAFERLRKAKSLARPTLITLNGEPAVIQSAIEFPITTISATQTALTVSAQYSSIPLILSVVPVLTPDKKIMLDITITKKDIIDTKSYTVAEGLSQEFPVYADKRIDTKVVVGDGDTVVIGGILGESRNETNSGVPKLQRIPLLGWLFKEYSEQNSRKELLIFITPTVLYDM